MDEGNWQSVPTILSGVVVGRLVGSISAVSRVRSLRAHFPEQRLVIEPRWLVIAIIPHNSFYFTLFSLLCISVPSTTEVTTVKGLRTRLKLRCFPEQFIPHYSIYVKTSHSGCALYRGFLNYDWTNRFLRHAAEVPNVPCSLWVFVFVPRWRGTCPPTFSCV